MRYFIFTIILVVPLLLTAQSKKEQISMLNLRVDSLSEALINERITNTQMLSDKSDKIFQLSQEINAIEQEKLEIESESAELLTKVHALTENIAYMEARLLELGDSLNHSSDSVNTLTENIAYMEARLLELGASFFTSCGDQIGHEGYNYSTVQIGEQCWFAENCRYLPEVSPSSEESSTEPLYYVYDYQGTDVTAAKSTSNYETYGVLYNRPAVMTEGICPSGWHIPTDGEFTELTDFLGGEDVAGGEVKEVGYDHWDSSNTGATNSSGWTGLAGGCRNSGGFSYNGLNGYWWSASESGSYSLYRELYNGLDDVYRHSFNRYYGFSARCVRYY
jgi:uncharacterized protein (TIGR02145 family)